MQAFGAYGRALASAGVLLSADVLQPTAAATTVTRREGGLRVQDGPFAETKEALAGIFLLDVPDLDAAIGWAEKCPGAQWGVVVAGGARQHRRVAADRRPQPAARPVEVRAGTAFRAPRRRERTGVCR